MTLTGMVKSEEFELPVADVLFLVKALKEEGIIVQQITFTTHVGDCFTSVNVDITIADSSDAPISSMKGH